MFRLNRASPASLLLLSYCLVILVGTILLLMPFSTVSGSIALVDALFTATSAVCVTGLIVVDTGAYFTHAGQMIILAMIQLGGLGIMTISVSLFLFIGKRVPFKHRLAMQDVFAHTPRRDIYGLVRSVLFFTLTVETIGIGLLLIHFVNYYPLPTALYHAVFHSISAFCNAGFSLFANSFVTFRGSALLNFTICGLIVLGGIGFPVVYEIYLRMGHRSKSKRLSVHTKVVLSTSTILIVAGTLAFASLEKSHAGPSFWSGEFWLASMFQSITARTAGFNTLDIGGLGTSTLTFVMFLMFFGASPGSCGGGLKTTTLAILFMHSVSRIRGSQNINIFKRSVPRETVNRAISLFMLSISLLALMFFALLVVQEPWMTAVKPGPEGTMGQRPFLTHLFEVISAFGTVGLSMGVTASLETMGKVIIVVLMLVGRVGVPSFTYLIFRGNGERSTSLHYAEEKMMLG